jgi:hypothetical protein
VTEGAGTGGATADAGAATGAGRADGVVIIIIDDGTVVVGMARVLAMF